jgi:diadenosine tetraphosphatase ApaH/serine/threonine PP2A family protein phosphatase
MRALILSDIHANLDALDAVLAAAPQHDTVWNLGDIVGYGAMPNETIERVQELGTFFVRGNHDRACSSQIPATEFNPVAARAVLWTQQTLTPEHSDWLKQLPVGPVIPEGHSVSCMHGSILDEDEYLLSAEDAWFPLKYANTRVNFFGHTHVQGGFAADDEECRAIDPGHAAKKGKEMAVFPLRRGLRYLLNPGSVGQPRDGDWRAAFAVFDDEQSAVEFHRVPYDVRVAQMRILRAGLPERLATRLREGH